VIITHKFPSTVKKLLAVLFSFLVMGLVACSDGNEPPPIPMQHWQEMDVRIEPHPNPPVAGISEIVVIVTGPHGRPIHDLIISLRGNEAVPWVQTIQDGYMGAYRRAVDIGSGDTAVLQVRLQRGDEQKVLLFPLKLAAG
jgi:hypothetical protein